MTRSRCTLALVMLWVFSGIAADAMTFVPMSVEDLTRSSVATVIGTVESVKGSKSASGQIFTLVKVVVDRVVRGNLTAPVITLKEPGGTVGTEQEVLFGAPSFQPGEHVVLFLTVGADGSLRTNQLALGKFDVEVNADGVPQAAQRFERGTTVLVPPGASPPPSSIPLDALLSEVEAAAPATDGAAAFQTEPPAATTEEFTEPFKFLGSPPSRFFEPDEGQSISYLIDQTGDATLGLEPLPGVGSRPAVDAAFSAWTNVATATISLVDGGLTSDLILPCAFGAHKVVFNDPDGIIPNPVSCAGILALGGNCSTSSETKVVNGTTFWRAKSARVTFANGWGACPVWTQCNVAEVATHEIGHSIGLGHSSDADATMYSQCHCDGLRCAAVQTDDINGVTFIYPPASPHDSVVLPVKPRTVTLALGTLSVSKTVKVKVRNADRETFGLGHKIQLSASTTDCPAGTIADLPDFDAKTTGAQDSVFVNGRKSKTAKVPLVISSAAFATFNRKAPTRCTITFTASTIEEPGNVDPNQSNDTVTMELNVIDRNDPEMSAVHESVITSMKPVKLTIPNDSLSKVKTVRPAVVNADILPQPESPGHLMTVTASDGDCPAGTVGVVDYDSTTPGSQNSKTVKGGTSAAGKLAVTVNIAGFATPNLKSPQRCTAVLTVAGPAGDTDSTNNTTKLVIDVTDKNVPPGALIHQYELNGTYADSLGGPAMVPNGGTLGLTGYTFAAGQGPNLSSAIPTSNYTIEMGFYIDNTFNYRKLIDFKDRTSDKGIYNDDTALKFYPLAAGPAGAFAASVPVTLVVARNGSTGVIKAYVNRVLQFTYADAANDGTFTGTNNIAHFLRDDAVTGGEQSSGFLDFVRIYDGPFKP